MRGGGDEEVSAEQQQRTLSVVSTAVSVVAAVFLGGGFYYGMTKQQKALAEEEKNSGKSSTSKKEFKPKSTTFFEKKLALDKPLPPSTAAWKALFGVTLVSVTGCCVLVGGAAVALGVSNLTELRERLQKTPRSQKTAVGIQSKQLDFEGLGEVKREILDVIADEVKEEKLKGDK
ncbi:ADP/ATP translocase [Phytophthora cinnamomi]|uniref:ADP/ATP translocase n=1 Tax=Phytophthora cinnamomi TaxID=4785 RepID=UPI00355A7446|nr:ADP/ATP translocase [Phytophthora cinnamomi]